MRVEWNNETGEMRLVFNQAEAQAVHNEIQQLRMWIPERITSDQHQTIRIQAEPLKEKRPSTKRMHHKTLEALKEIRTWSGLQQIPVRSHDLKVILATNDIRPGNFNQSLERLETRAVVELTRDTKGRIRTFQFNKFINI